MTLRQPDVFTICKKKPIEITFDQNSTFTVTAEILPRSLASFHCQ